MTVIWIVLVTSFLLSGVVAFKKENYYTNEKLKGAAIIVFCTCIGVALSLFVKTLR